MLKPYACLALFCSLFLPSLAHVDDSDVGCVTTEWKLFGANHKIYVSTFNDPGIPGMACYTSQAKTGGVSGSFGLVEGSSNLAISYSQVSPIETPARLPKQTNVFHESTSVFFKAICITRIWDTKRNMPVYLAANRHLMDGSPFNATSMVSVRQ